MIRLRKPPNPTGKPRGEAVRCKASLEGRTHRIGVRVQHMHVVEWIGSALPHLTLLDFDRSVFRHVIGSREDAR